MCSLYDGRAGGDKRCALCMLEAAESGLSFGVSKFPLWQFSRYSLPPAGTPSDLMPNLLTTSWARRVGLEAFSPGRPSSTMG